MTAQYETLRAAALGGRLPPEARNGLALLLRRGMWAWARAAAAPSPPPPARSSLASWTAADAEQRAVVRLFAAMALPFANRRTHERIAQSPSAPPRA